MIFNAGAATTFISSFDLTGLCFHLGTVLFTAYFPFRARQLQKNGGYKYLHLVAVISIIGISGFLVGFQFALGGYSRTAAPIFCLGSPESAFLFGVVPACVTSALFLTFVIILLFKIVALQGWTLSKVILLFYAVFIIILASIVYFSVLLERECE